MLPVPNNPCVNFRQQVYQDAPINFVGKVISCFKWPIVPEVCNSMSYAIGFGQWVATGAARKGTNLQGEYTMKMKTLTIIAVTALMTSLAAHATIVFQDTFDMTDNTVNYAGLNVNLPARQAAGNQASDVTWQQIVPATAPGTSIAFGPAYAGQLFSAPVVLKLAAGVNDVVMRSNQSITGLVGNQYTVSFRGNLNSSVVGTDNGAVSFIIGSGALNASGPGASQTPTGLAVSIYNDGRIITFDGSSILNVGHSGLVMKNGTYDFSINIDEVADTLDYTMNMVTGASAGGNFSGASVDISGVNLGAERKIALEQYSLQWSTGAVASWLVDDLTIDAVPEPATFGLFALMGGGLVWMRKRFKI